MKFEGETLTEFWVVRNTDLIPKILRLPLIDDKVQTRST